MTRHIIVTILFSGFSFIAPAQQKNDATTLISRPADVGLIYPVSTNGINAAHYSDKISLQAIAGVSGAITGCAIAGIANMIKGSASGAVFAGITNIIGDYTEGAQFAGIFNVVTNETSGIQAAGLINKTGSMKGVQVAGVENIAHGESKGVQLAGIMNRSGDTNTQMAGLINIARKVKGVQISGLINIADSSDYAIGFINIIKNGEKNISISTDEIWDMLVSFRSGGRVLYGIIGVGYNLKSRYPLYAFEAGIGAHLFRLNHNFRINGEAAQLVLTDFKNGHCFSYSLRLLPEVKIGNRIALFAGPTVNLALDYSHKKLSNLVPHYVWTSTGPGGHFIGSYFGMTGGVKFIL